MRILFSLFVLTFSASVFAQKTVSFKAKDGLEVTADLYLTKDEKAPMIILFHQAGWSRGEYKEIAPKLNELGFSCMAVDQRSGGDVNDIDNETFKRAEKQGLPTAYIDAIPDLNAAIDYVKSNYKAASHTLIWGSSYSAGLVLKIASERKDIDGVLAFSPGEYYTKMGKPKDWITSTAESINVPTFITSAKMEKKNWWDIAAKISEDNRAYFLPTKLGKHGSRALWSKYADSAEYWKAVKEFLALFQ